MPAKRTPQQPGVYFITGSDLVKIGIVGSVRGGTWTGTLTARLGNLQTGSPVPLALHRFIPCGLPQGLERGLHIAFADLRDHGEWFDRAVLSRIDGRTDDEIITEFFPMLGENRGRRKVGCPDGFQAGSNLREPHPLADEDGVIRCPRCGCSSPCINYRSGCP